MPFSVVSGTSSLARSQVAGGGVGLIVLRAIGGQECPRSSLNTRAPLRAKKKREIGEPQVDHAVASTTRLEPRQGRDFATRFDLGEAFAVHILWSLSRYGS
jgi:hypothetical protein